MKATAFLELKKMQEATQHFQAAVRLAPVRYEAYTGKDNGKLFTNLYLKHQITNIAKMSKCIFYEKKIF